MGNRTSPTKAARTKTKPPSKTSKAAITMKTKKVTNKNPIRKRDIKKNIIRKRGKNVVKMTLWIKIKTNTLRLSRLGTQNRNLNKLVFLPR